ncbi:histidine kinase [Deminuibacter soli]|uniref:Histidine kinase n=2 Tax=Deminuibacter soli TaxID=2291815 RepID=A0A3E1NG15_9BACT|nr:histidine kinase [Deminuibacter soli]
MQQVNAQPKGSYLTKLNMDNGLANNKVNCVLKDKRGFVWLGTEDGLSRYDGKHFTNFASRSNDSTTLPGAIVTSLLEDNDSIIWIATADGGLTAYNYRLSAPLQLTNYQPHTATGVLHIEKITADFSGNLWLAAAGYPMLRFNKSTRQFDMPFKEAVITAEAVCIDSAGMLWMGSMGGGLLKIDTRNLQSTYVNIAGATTVNSSTLITSLFTGSDLALWCSTASHALFCLSTGNTQPAVVKTFNGKQRPDDEIIHFAETPDNLVLMSGRHSGMIMYDKQTGTFSTYSNGFSQQHDLLSDHVNCVYNDYTGITWLGTNYGVYVYNPLYHPFSQIFLPPANGNITVYDFYKDIHGSLWIATSNGLFVQKNGSSGFEHRALSWNGVPLSVQKILADTDGSFYLGTDYSLFVYNPAGNALSLLPNTANDPVMGRLKAPGIVSIVKDTIHHHPVLIVSPYGYPLAGYDLAEQKWIHPFGNNVTPNQVRKICRIATGGLWLATATNGLKLLQQQATAPYYSLQQRTIKSNLQTSDIFDVLEDGAGNIWASSYGGGLIRYNNATQTAANIEESSNLVEGLQNDPAGNIWMISNGHLHKYNPHARKYSCYSLPGSVYSSIKGYMYKDNNGILYIGGTNYYIAFDPQQVKEITSDPTVYFTDFKIFNDSYNHLLSNGNIHLAHNQNYFSIEFAAPEFSGGGNVQYSYMLEGVDADWINSGDRNFASYSNLPGGDYVFKVKAGNWRGTHGTQVTALNIHITPPIWQHWWFYLLPLLLVAGILWLQYRAKIKALLNRQEIRNKIAKDLHDHLGSTLSSIAVYSQVAKINQQQQKEEQLTSILDKIGNTANEMIGEMSDIVWAINPLNDQVINFINRIESFARPLCAASNVTLLIHYDESLTQLNMDMDKRNHLYLMCKESINNAVKYANASSITLHIGIRNNQLLCTIEDNGCGFQYDAVIQQARSSLSGNGLKNMAARAASIKASYKIDTGPGTGTRISITCPLP